MADNTTLNTGTGGDVMSTDDLGTVKVQRVKVQFGIDGTAADVTSFSPLPVTDNTAADGEQLQELLRLILGELRVLNHIIASEFRVRDDLVAMRNDLTINLTN